MRSVGNRSAGRNAGGSTSSTTIMIAATTGAVTLKARSIGTLW